MSDRMGFGFESENKLWLPLTVIALAVFLLFEMSTNLFEMSTKKPAHTIPNSAAYGCYHSDLAPSIRLDDEGMHILQEGFPTIPYHLERHKRGIALTADRPIQARANGERYEYSFYNPGVGTFLPFYSVRGRSFGAFEADYLSGFFMYPRSFVSGHSGYIVYVESASDDC